MAVHLSDVLTVLRRGVRQRCPQCGRSRLYVRWYSLEKECNHCGLPIAVEDGDTWAFMYMSTAFLTGVILAAMFLLRPPTYWLGRTAIVVAALALILGTLPLRKSIALAINYLITLRWDNHAGLRLRRDEES